MFKKMILASWALLLIPDMALAATDCTTPAPSVNPATVLTPAQNAAMEQEIAKALAEQEANSMSDLSHAQSQRMRRDAAKFVGKAFYITDSCLNEDQKINQPPERLDEALRDRMMITGKWPHVAEGVTVEGGIIMGQGMCTAFVVRNAQHRVLAVGSVSVDLQGIPNGGPLAGTDPNIVDTYYMSHTDLQKALPQINGFARYYIKDFNDPSSPVSNPPPTYLETQYDLHGCGVGKSGKRIHVKTCPKKVETLPVVK